MLTLGGRVKYLRRQVETATPARVPTLARKLAAIEAEANEAELIAFAPHLDIIRKRLAAGLRALELTWQRPQRPGMLMPSPIASPPAEVVKLDKRKRQEVPSCETMRTRWIRDRRTGVLRRQVRNIEDKP
jgi:hypothetical protein